MADSEDQTNLHWLARHNTQEAISLAKQRAQDFDAQAALERKTDEVLRLAKGQAHLRDSEEEQTEGAPPIDRTCCPLFVSIDIVDTNFRGCVEFCWGGRGALIDVSRTHCSSCLAFWILVTSSTNGSPRTLRMLPRTRATISMNTNFVDCI